MCSSDLEGEMDALCAISNGYDATTTTGGAGNWKTEFNKHFVGKHVTLCYDNDEAGRKGALKAIESLREAAASVSVAAIGEPGEDVSDVLVSGRSLDPFLEASASMTTVGGSNGTSNGDEAPADVTLAQAAHSKYTYKKIRASVIVAGKDLAPFSVPKRVQATCVGTAPKCQACGIARSGGMKVVEFDCDKQDFLRMIQAKETEVKLAISNKLEVPSNCKTYECTITEYASILPIKCIPEIDWSLTDSPYVIRQLYYAGSELDTNRSYVIEATAMPDPKTQYTTALVHEAIVADTNIDSFEVKDRKSVV